MTERSPQEKEKLGTRIRKNLKPFGPFLEGFARSIDIAGARRKNPNKITNKEAFAGDLEMIGRDFKKAMGLMDEELKGKGLTPPKRDRF